MGLTSGWLIGLAGAFAAGAFAGTLWMWRRLAGPQPRRVLARIAWLLCAQVSVMLVLFLSVNRSFGFFATWSDLFGTNNTTGQIVAPRDQAGGQPTPIQPQGTGGLAERTLPGAPQAGHASSLTGPGSQATRDGRLQPVRINGVRSGISAAAYVYLPAQYFQPAQAGRRFAVVLVISDQVTRVGDPYSAISLANAAAQETASGRATPAIYVMLAASVAGGRDRGCIDVPGGPQAGTFFSQDLPAAVESSYPASQAASGWAVVGDASGGYCALSLAIAHSDRFGAAAAPLAGYGTPPGAAGTRSGTTGWWMSGGSPQLRDESDLSWRLRNLPPPPVLLCFVQGASTGQQPSAASGGERRASAAAFLSLMRHPTSHTQVTLATGAQATAPVIDRITAALTSDGQP